MGGLILYFMAGAGEAIGGIMTGLANMANSIVQPISQKRQQKRNQKYAKENAKLEADLQLQNNLKTMEQQQAYNVKNYEQQRDDSYAREDYLLANQKKFEVEALRNAGLNPALAGITGGGFQPGASVSAPSLENPTGGASAVGVSSPNYASPFTGVNLGDAVKGAMEFNENLKILKAEARKRTAEADNAELGVQGRNDANNFAQFSMLNNLTYEDGKNGWGWYHDGEDNDGNVERVQMKSMPSTLEGLNALNTYQRLHQENKELQSRSVSSQISKMVANLQVIDSDVLNALSKMPTEVFENLRSKTSLQDVQSALTNVEKDVKSNEKAFWTELGKLDNDAVRFIASMIYSFRK